MQASIASRAFIIPAAPCPYAAAAQSSNPQPVMRAKTLNDMLALPPDHLPFIHCIASAIYRHHYLLVDTKRPRNARTFFSIQVMAKARGHDGAAPGRIATAAAKAPYCWAGEQR